ncbi:MAG: ABC transporter ATP-binding protein [Chloroflexota bacterium]|nr:ABC transporter ATP-binding protein [Chloroflexota bacterium]
MKLRLLHRRIRMAVPELEDITDVAEPYEETDVADKSMIVVQNLSKTYGRVRALDRISLNIESDEVFGLLGPNGSGKTTLLRILATVIPPNRRGVRSVNNDVVCRIAGYDLYKGRKKVRRAIGYVPQRDALYDDLSALDNLMFFSAPYGVKGNKERALELLSMVGLYERRNSLVKTFSGGMLKRLSIICSLVHEPPVIFLDEPTVGLDAQTRREIWSLVGGLKHGRTIVTTTHYTPEAEENCDRVALIFRGHLLDIGTPAEVISRYPPAVDLEGAMSIAQQQSLAESEEIEDEYIEEDLEDKDTLDTALDLECPTGKKRR